MDENEGSLIADTIHSLIGSAAAEYWDRTAVVDDAIRLTYGQVWEYSEKAAAYIIESGIKPGSLVGLYGCKNAKSVVIILGLLKAGCSYLPLDPGHPQERTAYILEDSCIDSIIMERSSVLPIPGQVGRILVLEDIWDTVLVDTAALAGRIQGESSHDRAYVLYTSGSSGRPKGVEIGHSAVVNLLLSLMHEPGIQEKDVFLSVTSLTFDISVLELFLPLAAGAQLLLMDERDTVNGAVVSQKIKEYSVTVMQATPTMWKLLIESGWDGSQTLKILCGGEAMTEKLASGLLKRCASLWNMYGPTETTIWSAAAHITDSENIVLGRPVRNTALYVLDEEGNTVRSGETGTLYISGAGLFCGYWNSPELTKEKLLMHSRVAEGAKLYNTGDLVKMRPDGEMEYVGRTDFQVKIRGYRIELGEVENMAEKAAGVKQAAAVVKEDGEENRYIVLFLTVSPDEFDLGVCRDYLRTRLPAYMLPSRYEIISSFPMTPNKKIDRKWLQKMQLDHMAQKRGLGSQMTENGKKETIDLLLEIWGELLQLDDILPDEHFLDLGGHSLLATKLVGRVNKQFGTDISLQTFLLKGYTINMLADIIGGMS